MSLISLDYLYTAVAWVLLRWHQFFSLFMNDDSGVNWALSIVMLVVTARLLLFRLFIKQVHFQRRMQEMAPKFQEIKKKYKDDRQAQQRATMELQREEGFNPLAGCLPMFLQIPVFLGLYHVLRHLANSVDAANRAIAGGTLGPGSTRQLTLYTFSQNETISAAKAKLFGAPLAGSFRDTTEQLAKLGADATTTRLVILPLLLISALATFLTQLLTKRAQTVAPTGTSATLQKVFLWVFPLGVLASGLIFNFPLGVLLYWFTSNLWTLAQQAYILRFHPATTPQTPELTADTARAVAPRPGQKPNIERGRGPKGPRPANGPAGKQPPDSSTGPADVAVPAGESVDADGVDPAASEPNLTPSKAPATPVRPTKNAPARPGNRPGTRPAAKRTSRPKKRR